MLTGVHVATVYTYILQGKEDDDAQASWHLVDYFNDLLSFSPHFNVHPRVPYSSQLFLPSEFMYSLPTIVSNLCQL